MSESVFSQTESESSAMAELVGEGKKFATIEDLAKGKLEADSFIEQLQGEAKLKAEQLATLEKKAEQGSTIQELLEAVKVSTTQTTETSNQPLSDEALSSKVKSIMEGETQEQTKAANLAKANKAVLDKLEGNVEAARTYVAERAKALGTTVDKLQALGQDSPSAFQKLMEIDSTTVQPSITSLTGVAPPTDTETVIDGHKTKAYYDNLKKEMGASKYWQDHKIQAQFYKDAMALEDRFNQ